MVEIKLNENVETQFQYLSVSLFEETQMKMNGKCKAKEVSKVRSYSNTA